MLKVNEELEEKHFEHWGCHTKYEAITSLH
jgi:hypothetical protein